MRPARRSIPPVRAATLVPTPGPCAPDAVAALGITAPAGIEGDCGARPVAGVGAGVALVHAAMITIANAPIERTARMVGRGVERAVRGRGECQSLAQSAQGIRGRRSEAAG